MSDFTYDTYNPERRDIIRLLLQDTDPTEPLLDDFAIDTMIKQWGSKGNDYYVAYQCAKLIAARFAREINVSSDSQSLGTSELQQKYLTLADDLLATSESLSIGEVDWATPHNSVTAPSFGIAMHDNLRAGNQQYGNYPEGSGNVRYVENEDWIS